jgi:hypothetical protein
MRRAVRCKIERKGAGPTLHLNKTFISLKVAVVWLILIPEIRQVPSSLIVSTTGYPDSDYSRFFSSRIYIHSIALDRALASLTGFMIVRYTRCGVISPTINLDLAT